jgi:MFS family permease
MRNGTQATKTATIAWLITSVYYFYQYALRSAPAVMMPQLGAAFGLTAGGVASMAGLFYYGYSPFSLVAGVAMDRLGPRRIVPIGAAAVGVGALMFATGNGAIASAGRLLQGAGGVFALIGAAYIATTNFPASRAATLIGATQMFGMAGGSAGQFVVGPVIGAGVPWSAFWAAMGVAGVAIGAALFVLLPHDQPTARRDDWLPAAGHALVTVFRNPQSLLCGIIAGLLFLPTTIFDMIWGVRYLQEARGLDYATAVLRSSMVPIGWIIGCPLLGFVSDRIGRRKPVIAGGAVVLFAALVWILFGRPDVFPANSVALVGGIASGAAMLPYTVIKEANPPEMSGTATGVVNFLNFTFSALLAPVFGRVLIAVSGGAEPMRLEHYQTTFAPLAGGIALALVLTFFLKETGPAAHASGIAPGGIHESLNWNRQVRPAARKMSPP